MIRDAQSSDLAAVFNLVSASSDFNLQQSMFARTYVDQLSQERHKLGVYEQDGEVIGFVGMLCTWQLHLGTRIGEIKELVVDKSHCNADVRDQLLAWAQQRACAAGCECIAVTSRLSHTASHEFYLNQGFTETHYRFEKNLKNS
ncbi:GCN5-related N-acetyltransferase [Coriobacterium glomerans PW2]|uniref:GCN5-related N-acetyltransferase n=1 Tax=Coriobacterium glomerans (strain ATCC 49209 / DSM 20642 / JCM 10262 / PW2) TaxID=700015 RepID=F2N8R7_CORGP|nr:GNAT family N-acetyltransferase [Coriobacterium glomerans]AEB07450.1 GCN5-related N-acetyltransferase [Coriobacterium glomerans PW2]